MFVTTKMSYLVALLLKEDSSAVAKTLLEWGLVDFVSVKELKGMPIDSINDNNDSSSDKIADLRRRVDNFLEITGGNFIEPNRLNVQALEKIDLNRYNKTLDFLAADLEDVRKEQKIKGELIERLKRLEYAYKKGYAVDCDQLPAGRTEYLNIRFGRIATTNQQSLIQAFAGQTAVIEHFNEGKATLIKLAYLKTDEKQIEALLSPFQWQELPSTASEAEKDEQNLEAVRSKLQQATKELEQLQEEVKHLVASKKSELERMWINLRINELYTKTSDCFSETEQTSLFSGWVPSNKVKKLTQALQTITANRFIYQEYRAGSLQRQDGHILEAPTQMQNPKVLSPFEMLIKSYAIPAYNTVDPTVFVSFLFVIMFGAMFADAGQGLVLAATGAFMCLKMRHQPSMVQLGQLIIYCGIASVVAGVLFGSYFGYPLFAPLWFDYHGIVTSGSPHFKTYSSVTAITNILGLTLQFGLLVIGLSFVLNFINRFKRGEWIDLFFNRNGLTGAIMFTALVYSAYGYVASGYKAFAAINIVGPLLLVLSCVLFFEEPLKHFAHIQKTGNKTPITGAMLGEWVINWLIELMEFFINSMSNTLSFIRVSALGIAHVALMSALYGIAAEVNNMVLSIVIIIFTNILVIALEGFSAGINSVRLNYYEFFGRYFLGGGYLYSPLSLK